MTFSSRRFSRGKRRERVIHDVELAMRLGMSGTPSFVTGVVLGRGERWAIEAYFQQTGGIARRPAGSQ